MDERTYCLTPEQWRHAKACLTLAKRWGLIGDDSPELEYVKDNCT